MGFSHVRFIGETQEFAFRIDPHNADSDYFTPSAIDALETAQAEKDARIIRKLRQVENA